MKSAYPVAASAPLPSNTYIYKIIPSHGDTKLISISSDDSLRSIDASTLCFDSKGIVNHVHTGVTDLKAFGEHGALTAGKDCKVKYTDLRTEKLIFELSKGTDSPFLSLAFSDNLIAAGTELTNHEASIIIWDCRATKCHLLEFVESHSDDITNLSFDPSRHPFLLSGSMDGLVNYYDTSIADEDDALIQVFNHGSSIAHANFLSDDEVFAISHDEIFSIYDTKGHLPGVGHGLPCAFGDLRPQLGCEYVVNLASPGSSKPVIGVGSHSTRHLDIVPLRRQPRWTLDRSNNIRLPGAHGEDIVRSLYLNGDGSTIYTAGEDGLIKAWRAPEEDDSNALIDGPVGHNKKRKKHNGLEKDERARFKPY